MKKTIVSIGLSLITISVFAQCGIDVNPASMPRPTTASTLLAPSNGLTVSSKTVKLEMATAVIRSTQDLDRYMNITPPSKNPINALSPSGKASFLGSLAFNEKGLTGYKYSDLENELTPTQIHNILSLFGSQHNTAAFKHAKVKTLKDSQLLTASVMAADECNGDTDPTSGGTGGGDGSGGYSSDPGTGGLFDTKNPNTDYLNYECGGRATCVPHDTWICKASC